MRNRKLLLNFLVLGITCLFPFAIKAASTPVYDSDINRFYANGTEITIAETNGQTVIYWDGEKSSQVVNDKTVVVGGGAAGTHFTSSNITMNSGTIYGIIGGGYGSTTSSADVDEVNITINGGKISQKGGYVYGGGRLASKVKKTTITMNDGEVGAVNGGGAAYDSNTLNVGTKAEPEKSSNITETAIVNIKGGSIVAPNAGYGLLYGGGQSYSYVKNTTINISGNVDLSKTWVVAGGANGRTDEATLNVDGGKINVIQTINRGSMINATVNFRGGTVEKFYVGGEDPEAFDNDIVNGGFLGNITIDITGGTVKNLLPGSNYDKSITANADYVTVFYKKANVTNASALTTSLGTSAKEYATSEADETVIEEEVSSDTTLNSSFLEALSSTNNIYQLVVDKGTVSYAWILDGSTITDPNIEINTEITFTEEAPDRIKDELDEKTNGLENVAYLNFSHHGNLPGPATIVYYVGDKYADGTKLYIRHYNETTNKLEDPIEVTVENGTITFDITSCSSYVLSTTAPASISNPQTGDNIIYLVGFLAVGLLGTLFTTKKVLKQQ